MQAETRLQSVDVGERSLDAFENVALASQVDEVRHRARGLRGARVLHLSATPYGGGVSELLRSEVPLMNDLGLDVDWKVIGGDDPFFNATKAMHNALQGSSRGITAADREAYLTVSAHNAGLLEDNYDVVFVHDPQPAALLALHGRGSARWVWRCHIDTAAPNPEVWSFLREYVSQYDSLVFTMAEFAPPDLDPGLISVVPPAIDPLSPKNLPLPVDLAQKVLNWIGIRLNRPLVTQVSRFDPWKDPLGVIAAYRLAREEVPGLQLGLVGSMALDDPEGWEVYRHIHAASASDPLIHVFTNLTGVGNIEVNAFQRLSDVVVQKSIREGFGLVVSEALWKGTPVVAGRTGGIPMQMPNGDGGALVDSIEECARAIVGLIRDRDQARESASRGREHVRARFLLSRLLLDKLALIARLTGDGAPHRRSALYDDLTGLFSRSYFEVTLAREIDQASRRGGTVAVMLASLDQLEAFNNAEGRAAGDQLLRSFGQLVKQRSRSGDVAARYSGRAFALMLPSAPAEIALARAGDLRVRAAELKARPGGAQPTISMAVGVAPADASSATALLTTLDEALAQAARQGGDRLIRAGENSS